MMINGELMGIDYQHGETKSSSPQATNLLEKHLVSPAGPGHIAAGGTPKPGSILEK